MFSRITNSEFSTDQITLDEKIRKDTKGQNIRENLNCRIRRIITAQFLLRSVPTQAFSEIDKMIP